MPVIILLRGAPGTGKSEVARIIGSEFSAWDVVEAVRRKLGQLEENYVRAAHGFAAMRRAHPREFVLDTTSIAPAEVARLLVKAVSTRER